MCNDAVFLDIPEATEAHARALIIARAKALAEPTKAIMHAVMLAISEGEFSCEVENIPSEFYEYLKNILVELEYSVEVDNFADGTPVKFHISW